jgi:hypothetical protein
MIVMNKRIALMNKPKSSGNIIMELLPFLLAGIIMVLIRIGTANPWLVEDYYSNSLYPFIAGVLSPVSSFVKYSLWDIFWISISLFALTGFALVLLRRLRPLKYFLRLAQLIALIYAMFYFLWGFNYFRPGLNERLGWGNELPGEAQFRVVLDSLVSATNRSYTEIELSDYGSMDIALEKSFDRCSDILSIKYPNGNRHPKTILISSYFAKSGVSGYFGPFFNEVHINHYQLPCDYPFIVAHEKAHQFGYANEAEANFAAFIVCTNSGDPRLEYSGFMHLLIYFLKEAHGKPEYMKILRRVDRNVMDDILRREDYYENLKNKKLENIQATANDVYLKTQNISTGVRNYDQVVALTIRWYEVTGLIDTGNQGEFTGMH